MLILPQRIFFDTNVYIVGSLDPASSEFQILRWSGFDGTPPAAIEIIVSEDLFDEILRVAKRLRNKDWAGEIFSQIGRNLNLRYVLIDHSEIENLANTGIIPTEDVEVYLTARNGQAECFVSANHELVRALVRHTGEFECLTPAEFVAKYLQSS